MGVEASENQRLYIRLPVRIKDELEIRDLHPNIIKVQLPRQKSRRWCIIEFEDKDRLQEAVVALKKVKINNKSIKLSPFKGEGNKPGKLKRTASVSTQPLLKLLKKSTRE